MFYPRLQPLSWYTVAFDRTRRCHGSGRVLNGDSDFHEGSGFNQHPMLRNFDVLFFETCIDISLSLISFVNASSTTA